MGISVTIEFTTDTYDYLVLKGDAAFYENFEDNEEVQELAKRLLISINHEEREKIANALWEECNYSLCNRLLFPEGRLEVTYENSEGDDIDENYVILDEDWIGFKEFIEDHAKSSSFCLVRNSYSKRAHFYLTTKLAEPFCGEHLKIKDGCISYKGEEFEFSGDAGGWIEENEIYVLGNATLEDGETELQESIDWSQNILQKALNKLAKVLEEEVAVYNKQTNEIERDKSAEMFAAWKEIGIPDDGNKNWDELLWETQRFTFKPSDESKLEKLEQLEKTNEQQYKDLKSLQTMTRAWETKQDLICKKYLVKTYLLSDPLNWEVVIKYTACQDRDTIESWDQSTRKKILDLQSNVDALKKQRDAKKLQQHIAFGYGVSGAYWDSTLMKSVGWASNEWHAVFLSYQFHIEVFMIKKGKSDIHFRGKNSEEYTKRIQEWSDAMDEIDRDYCMKINHVIDRISTND